MPDSQQNLDEALEAQQALVETSLPAVFEAYDEAIEQAVEHPVVLLLDCEDAIGGEIARSMLGEETVADAIAYRAADSDETDETTVFAAAFSLTDCRRELGPVFPYLAPGLAGPPAGGGFWVISVTSGGASLLEAPLDARP
jgi:hypothetical protein